MKRLIIFIFILTLQIFHVQVSSKELNEDSALLQLKIKNIKHDHGKIFIAVFNAEKSFMKDRYADEIVLVKSIEDLVVEMKLPHGSYAVSIFHDVNNNEKLNTNFMGIPKEPYGFSNNPKITFGPPNFAETSFVLVHGSHELEIVLK